MTKIKKKKKNTTCDYTKTQENGTTIYYFNRDRTRAARDRSHTHAKRRTTVCQVVRPTLNQIISIQNDYYWLRKGRIGRAHALTILMTITRLPLPGAHARTTTSSCGSMEVINGYSVAGFESNTVYGENGLLSCTPAPGLPPRNTIIILLLYYCTNRGTEECRLLQRWRRETSKGLFRDDKSSRLKCGGGTQEGNENVSSLEYFRILSILCLYYNILHYNDYTLD